MFPFFSRCLLLVVLAMSLGLIGTGNARGEAVFRLEPVAGGGYVISGTGLEKIAALDFIVRYDVSTARNPRVSKGPFIPADASFFANTAIPGELRIMIVRGKEIAGNGILATVTFEKTGSSEPRILAFTSNPISVSASPLDASASLVSDKYSESAAGSNGMASDVNSGTITGHNAVTMVPGVGGSKGSSGGVVVLGTVSMPGDRVEAGQAPSGENEGLPPGFVASERQTVPQTDTTPEADERRVEPSISKPASKPKIIVYQSVLERMKGYKGERTVAALLALFNPVAGQEIRQEPPVVVSDGTTTVTLTVSLPLSLKNTPLFSFKNASMVSLEQADNGSWVIELIPRENTLEARITVSFDDSEITWPLVVVPALDPALLEVTGSPESAFALFLKQPEPGRKTRFDLNGDGKFDYLDDYLFSAHYLAARNKPALKDTEPLLSP